MNDQLDTRPFSQVLTDVGAGADPKLTLDELVEAFGERGFGALLLMLGLLSAVIGVIPGTTTLLGIPILIIGLQLALRRDELWLPRWLLKRDLPREAFAEAAGKVKGRLERVERFSKARLGFMSTDLSEALIGLACVTWAAVLMLPLIGFNLVPSLIVAAFGFGLMKVYFFIAVVLQMMRGQGQPAPQRPWDGAEGLEWEVPSPAPFHTFETPPRLDATATRVVG